jgi:hypothetical protein
MKSLSVQLGIILIGLAVFGYAGCSSSPKHWMRANYDPNIYRRDESFCREQEKRRADKSVNANEIYKGCMYTLGYFLTPEKGKWAGVKDGEVWKYYFSSAEYFAYYDAPVITRRPKDIFTVWVRWNLSKTFVKEFVTTYGNKFEDLSYIKQSVEVNCLEKKARSLSIETYDNEGRLIFSSYRPWEWNLVIPELESHSLRKEVCQ